jgi:subtilase family serine protease
MKSKNIKNRYDVRGFSIIEALITLFVLGLIGTVGLVLYNSHRRDVTTNNSACPSIPTNSVNKIRSESLLQKPPSLPTGYTCQNQLAGSEDLSMIVALNDPNQAAMEQFTQNVTNPSSPEYRHYLTSQETDSEFGTPQTEVTPVVNWLNTYGLPTTYDGFNSLNTTGTVAEFDNAFKTTIYQVKRADGSEAYANLTPLYVPNSLAKSIEGVVGADNLIQFQPE